MTPSGDFNDRLRRAGLRATAQRRAILGVFSGTRTEHLAAEEVLHRARETMPELSRATVYATLGDLTAAGLLRSFGRPDPVRYELELGDHQHFGCRRCGRTYDIQAGSVAARSLDAEGFVVERTRVLLEGTCAACVAFEGAMHEGAAAIRERGAGAAAASVACVAADSPVGPLYAAATAQGIARVAFAGQGDAEALRARAGKGDAVLDDLRDRLAAYFAGEAGVLDVTIDWAAVPSADADVLRATREVPWGETTGYARLAPRSDEPGVAAVMGRALGANPLAIVVPCHRVVRGGDELVDYTGGLERKRVLRALEAEPA